MLIIQSKNASDQRTDILNLSEIKGSEEVKEKQLFDLDWL